MGTHHDYRHHGRGLLRAAAEVVDIHRWPDPRDPHDCRAWLSEVWALGGIATAVRHASPVLATRVATILSGEHIAPEDVVRAALAVARYVLRAGGRSTPFGTFAGAGAVTVGGAARVNWGANPRAVVRAESRWLDNVLRRIESCPDMLLKLDVVANDTTELRDGQWEMSSENTISVTATPAVLMVREHAACPVAFGVLVDKLRHDFPAAGDPVPLLTYLVRNDFLLTSLRVPATSIDPLAAMLATLREASARSTSAASLVAELEVIGEAIQHHNAAPTEDKRVALAERMKQIAHPTRMPLSIDLNLDARVHLPQQVADEMQRAASVLARLARETTGTREWREYFAAFYERYGTGTLVPLRAVLNDNSGIGLPRGYPGGPAPASRHVLSERDRLLLALAAEATARGHLEVELDDRTVNNLAAAGGGVDSIPPHVDLGARIHASSTSALDRGEFTLTVAPARAAGTLTSRLTPVVPEAELGEVFAAVPMTTAGAVPVQLSFTPIHPPAENVSRVPTYLPEVLSIGEHAVGDPMRIDDLAVTATKRRLHLVSISRRCVVEPQVLHALAPKQQPPVARLVGELSRALDVGWIGFDWGAAATLPFRPRLRYGRAVLSAARWRLARTDLSAEKSELDLGLAGWRTTWRCPSRVELQDFDQLLPLNLDVAAHRAILYRHLNRNGDAVLLEAPTVDANGWIDDRAHTVVLPLFSTRAPVAGPQVELLPVLDRTHGALPGADAQKWLYAKLYLAEQHMDDLLVHQLPALLSALGDRLWWFVRYPQAREGEDADHLRLRIGVHDDAEDVLVQVARWGARLRAQDAIGRLAFDTYFPETGRYVALDEAESVFAADSRLVLAQLTHLEPAECSPEVLTALNMFDIATAFLGDRAHAADWLRDQAPPAIPDRGDVTAVARLARAGRQGTITGWSAVAEVHRQHRVAVAHYRRALPLETNFGQVLHSLLHMHHNRALGVDRHREAICFRLARQAAASWQALKASA